MIVTLEQARAMRWPFRNPRQPMGLLLDQGTITRPICSAPAAPPTVPASKPPASCCCAR